MFSKLPVRHFQFAALQNYTEMQDTLHTFREVRNKLRTVEKCKYKSTDAHSLPRLEINLKVRRLCIRSTFQAWDGDASRFWGFDDCGIITLTDTGNLFLVKYFLHKIYIV